MPEHKSVTDGRFVEVPQRLFCLRVEIFWRHSAEVTELVQFAPRLFAYSALGWPPTVSHGQASSMPFRPSAEVSRILRSRSSRVWRRLADPRQETHRNGSTRGRGSWREPKPEKEKARHEVSSFTDPLQTAPNMVGSRFLKATGASSCPLH